MEPMPLGELDKVYNPKQVEDKWYTFWLQKGYFHAEPNPIRKPYTIVIPPPNVTDVLHMGHAFNNTIQDILIRYHRMRGYETLWLPGTDHAGIATQNVVERVLLREEKLTRHDLGREKFVQRVWQWKEQKGGIIIEQLKKLGCSCDWARTRFTMDPGLSRAVLEVFVRLYRKGLIYRGKYIINWCPRCETALSDEEAIHQEHEGHLWYVKYPIKTTGSLQAGDRTGSSARRREKFITVATTRPETMLGDVAVAVHPTDSRYRRLVGQTAILPVLGREIPIIADEAVDRQFGTGAVKVTPAHDPNDFEIGKRHGLTPINVLNGNGTMNENAGKYQGYDRFKCRQALVKELEALGLLEKIEKHHHAVAHCQRCDTILEPFLSEQWFVRMKPLADPAVRVVQEGKVRFVPERWTKVYVNWMENIHDWCISRQLWWGHRIPVFYCDDCGQMMVEVEPPQRCTRCNGERLHQDEDVLDTWFSSWLWPFSTLGWPEDTPELRYFYPTDTLVTGHEIIFFWVARMIMAGLAFLGEIPFRTVYLHGIIRDVEGQKMSKSRGNVIDPLKMVEKYSADAVRFTLMMISAEGQDMILDEAKFQIGRNFSNKLWNAFRFLAMNLQEALLEKASRITWVELRSRTTGELSDCWILSRYHRLVQRVTDDLENFRFNDAVESLYHFFWHEYCDWYLELIKPRLQPSGQKSEDKDTALLTALVVLKGTLKLLHPWIPFITEEVWQKIRGEDAESIVWAPWPETRPEFFDEEAEKQMSLLQGVIGAVRNIRGEMNVPPTKKAEVIISATDSAAYQVLERNGPILAKLANADPVRFGVNLSRPRRSSTAVVNNLELHVPLEGLIDLEVERARLQKEVARLEKLLTDLNVKLSSQDFRTKAPKEIIGREERKREELLRSVEKLKQNLESLTA